MSKVVVIGAGIGGMSAAARIAKAGHQVEIFEAANFVGGKCRTEWIGRYAFDTAQWDQIMKRAEAMWDVSREPFIESELTSIAALFKRVTLIRDLLVIAPHKTLREMATEKLTDQRLRYIVDRYAT